MTINELLETIHAKLNAHEVTGDDPVQLEYDVTDHYGAVRSDVSRIRVEAVEIARPGFQAWEWNGNSPRQVFVERELRKVNALILSSDVLP